MLIDKDISIHISCQQFECNRLEIDPDNSVLRFASTRSSSEEVCPYCRGRVHVYDNDHMMLRDMPLWHGLPLNLDVQHQRYRCEFHGEIEHEIECQLFSRAAFVVMS